MTADPRSTWAYRRERASFIERSDLHCHWCHELTEPTAPKRDRRKTTVDHLIEVDKVPELALDASLWVIACLSCNASRGASYGNRRDAMMTQPSRVW